MDHKVRYKSKKGQLPFIELNGTEIADSDIIIKELATKFEKNLDEGLTVDQRNISHAFESMLNNHTSWVVRWWRYNNPDEFIKAAELDIKRTLNSRYIYAYNFNVMSIPARAAQVSVCVCIKLCAAIYAAPRTAP